jgi:hypothetical protein
MNTILIILLLCIALLVIFAFPRLRRNKTDGAAPPSLPERSPKLATMDDIEKTPLALWLLDQACAQTGTDLRNDPLALTRIAEAAAMAQLKIQTSGAAEISLPFLTTDFTGIKHMAVKITHEQASALRKL